MTSAIELAKIIASKSPVAVYGTKHNLNYSRDTSVRDGLEHMVCLQCDLASSGHIIDFNDINDIGIDTVYAMFGFAFV